MVRNMSSSSSSNNNLDELSGGYSNSEQEDGQQPPAVNEHSRRGGAGTAVGVVLGLLAVAGLIGIMVQRKINQQQGRSPGLAHAHQRGNRREAKRELERAEQERNTMVMEENPLSTLRRTMNESQQQQKRDSNTKKVKAAAAVAVDYASLDETVLGPDALYSGSSGDGGGGGREGVSYMEPTPYAKGQIDGSVGRHTSSTNPPPYEYYAEIDDAVISKIGGASKGGASSSRAVNVHGISGQRHR